MNVHQETYLQYMMRSMLKQLQLGQRNQDLLSFVDAAMKVEQQKLVMETHYSQDLSLLYILQEDYDRAKYYANNCMQVFMQVSFVIRRIIYCKNNGIMKNEVRAPVWVVTNT